jgi:hypothetical protein
MHSTIFHVSMVLVEQLDSAFLFIVAVVTSRANSTLFFLWSRQVTGSSKFVCANK